MLSLVSVKRCTRAAIPTLPRPASALRALAAVLVALLLLAQGASALHELLVPHRVCAEHGHRVHGNAASVGSFQVSRAGGLPVAIPGSAAEPEAHEHCALPARPQQTGVCLEHPSIGELARVLHFSRLPVERAPLRAGPPILLVAPKQSPPRA